MKPWRRLATAKAPDGGALTLDERDGELVIRIDGRTLMSSRSSESEKALARAGCEPLVGKAKPRILIGGLGLGFTLQAALELLPSDAEVVVAEISKAVVEWNQGPAAEVAGAPLKDPRVTVEVADVLLSMERKSKELDAILLDVDNGPVALTRPGNASLYGPRGLGSAAGALRPGGMLVVWSAGPDPKFTDRLKLAGFAVQTQSQTRAGKTHTLFIGQRSTRKDPAEQTGRHPGRGGRNTRVR